MGSRAGVSRDTCKMSSQRFDIGQRWEGRPIWCDELAAPAPTVPVYEMGGRDPAQQLAGQVGPTAAAGHDRRGERAKE